MALPRFVPLFLFFAFDALTQILSVMAVDTTRQLSDTINQFHADSTIVVLEPMVVRERRYTEYLPSHRSIAIDSAGGRLSDLTTILEGESGVNIQRQGGVGDFAVATIRGSTARQVQVFLDGMPLNSAEGGAVDIGKIPLTAIDNISIYKGYIPFERSGNGCGGVIDLTTDLTRDVFSAGVEAGGFGYLKAGGLFSHKLGNSNHRVAIDWTQAENNFSYLNNNVTEDNPADDTVRVKSNNQFVNRSAAYSLFVRFDEHLSLQSRLNYSDFAKGIYSFLHPDTAQYVQSKGTLIGVNERLQWNAEGPFFLNAMVGALYKNSILNDPAGQYYIGDRKDFSEITPLIQGDILAGWHFAEHQQVMAKISVGYDWYEHEDHVVTYALPPQASRVKSCVGIAYDVKIDGLLHANAYVTPRYEVDHANHDFDQMRIRKMGTDYDDSRVLVDGSVVAEWQWLPELALATHWSIAHKNPELFQKFGTDGLQFPSPDLKPEQERSGDIGVSFKLDWLHCAGSFYYAYTTDEIVFEQVYNTRIPKNMYDIRRIGAELDMRLQPVSWFDVDANGSVVYAVVAQSPNKSIIGNIRPLTPWYSINLTPTFHIVKQVQLSHDFLLSAPYYRSEYNIGAITGNLPILGASIAVAPLAGLSMHYRIDNYLNVQNYDFPNYPRPGTTHSIGATYTITN